MKIHLAILAAASLVLAAGPARGDDPWPAKPVRIVVPSAPGGGTDVFARLLGQARAGADRARLAGRGLGALPRCAHDPGARQAAGKARALAVDRRTALLPDVPTFAEAGMTFDAPTAFSVMAPAGIAPELQQRIAGDVVKALRAIAPRLEQQALVPVFDTPARFAADLKAERATWADFIRRNDIKAEQ